MNNSKQGIQRAFVLWVSGARLEDVRALAEAERLAQRGALVELDPAPITGPRAQHYQAGSGRSPARFGFFDTLVPACHAAGPVREGAGGYAVVEEQGGRGDAPPMLPDLLRAAGWAAEYREAQPDELAGCARALTRAGAGEGGAAECRVVKCALPAEASGFGAYAPAIAEALAAAAAWTGEEGLLALLSDRRPAPVSRFVNVNTFLAQMGLIERDERSGLVDWPNSLAYSAGHGQLWVNLLGRDPQGAVHPRGEYEEVRTTLIEALPARLRDEGSDARVIERVYRREELYPDEYLFCAPDLVLVFEPGYAPSPLGARLGFDPAACAAAPPGATSAAGVHPRAAGGFLLAAAPVLSPGAVAREAAPLTSVAPSLLHALGVAYAGMDGPAVSELFSPSYLRANPIRALAEEEGLSEEDEELVIARLRDLGYV